MKARKTRTSLSPACKERLIRKAAMGNVRLSDLEMEFGISNGYVRTLLNGAGIAIDRGWTVASDGFVQSKKDPQAAAMAEFEIALQLLNEAAAKLGLNPISSP